MPLNFASKPDLASVPILKVLKIPILKISQKVFFQLFFNYFNYISVGWFRILGGRGVARLEYWGAKV